MPLFILGRDGQDLLLIGLPEQQVEYFMNGGDTMARNQPDKPDWSNAETELPGVVLVESTSEEGQEFLASWEKPYTTVVFDTNAYERPPNPNTPYGRAGR